ncbi:unnamed protein product [Somion occarium]|uniref:RTA1-domain-containing protein n=1 Tax=Somion occarium TaxID=3059160 RepID=A0ABP1CLZ7_9APHY
MDAGSEAVPLTPADLSPYGYVPTLWICALFIALFGLSTSIHLFQAIYYRLWFLLPTVVLAGVTEIIGWSGRIWSSKNPPSLDPFLMQITTTIIAPTPLIAANFITLGQVISRLGSDYSRLNAMWYTIVFVTCDIVALVVQAVGGAQASIAVQDNRDPNPGGNVMLGGIAFQLGSITIYMLLAGEFILRYLYNRPIRNRSAGRSNTPPLEQKTALMLIGLFFSSLTIFIRSVYRTIELTDGWSGRIIGTERYFNWLDGSMITLAFYTINFLHPGRLIGPGPWASPRSHANTDTKEVVDEDIELAVVKA